EKVDKSGRDGIKTKPLVKRATIKVKKEEGKVDKSVRDGIKTKPLVKRATIKVQKKKKKKWIKWSRRHKNKAVSETRHYK
ncbi:unnamed protein product, partial [Ceratitis capitata]